jgi:L-aspartate oxidase
MTHTLRHDGVLIVGAGLAGLSAALAAAPRKVLLLSPAPLGEACSSAWAQGGMAAALSEGDTPEDHAADTMVAGAGLCDPEAVAVLTREGPDAVRRLAALGAPFDRTEDGGFAQSLEAAHGRPRVARIGGDGAGRAIMEALTVAVLAAPHIEVRTGLRARRLLQDAAGRVRGALVEDEAGGLTAITAAATLLTTGGLGGLYAVTTTPRELRGEGLGLAALAGAMIADPEFVQFHPTAIDVDADPAPLATEALRGEGAILRNTDGRAFMADYHPDAELAPRDVVARAIASERLAGRGAFLDATAAVGEAFPHEFPAVYASCMAAGIDPRNMPIPVVPACHYHMGGIATDLHCRTTLDGLLAAGECAAPGVHGANRLASNSLLEAAVFGTRAGAVLREAVDPKTAPLPCGPTADLPPEALAILRRAMSDGAGVVRDGAGLTQLIHQISDLADRYGAGPILTTARFVAVCALDRLESRGGHYRTDYPDLTDPHRTFVTLSGLEARKVAAE